MWVRICVWKLHLQPYVQNRKGNTIKFGREGALMAFLPPSRSYYRRRQLYILQCFNLNCSWCRFRFFSILHAFISKDLSIWIRSVEIIVSF